MHWFPYYYFYMLLLCAIVDHIRDMHLISRPQQLVSDLRFKKALIDKSVSIHPLTKYLIPGLSLFVSRCVYAPPCYTIEEHTSATA